MEHKRKRQGRRKLVRAAALASDGLKPGTVYRMAKAGLIPFYKTGAKGRGILFDPDEVLRAMRQPATHEQPKAQG
jgi:excisionase family DNA binding protein